jgi:type II secretory pathway pseudopilin PulG
MVELLCVMVILGILALIAIPSYTGFEENAHERTAELNVNSAIPVAVQYYTTNGDTYTGLDSSALKTLAPGLSPEVTAGSALTGGTAFCIQAQDGDQIWAYAGGEGGSNVLQEASCNSAYDAT